MKPRNPLLAEALSGLVRPGRAHLDHLNYLVFQALVVFAWWPGAALEPMLRRGEGPDTLMALVMALGVTTAYSAVRTGAEEVLLTGQHRLSDWAIGTSVPISRILAGYLYAHQAQMVHALALASPLLAVAYLVAGGDGSVIAWCLIAIVFQATFFRLVGAVTYSMIGHHGTMTFVCVRVVLVLGYLLPLGLFPAASHLAFSYRALNGGPIMPGDLSFNAFVFMAIYLGLSAGLVAVLSSRLIGERRREAAVTGASAVGNGPANTGRMT